MTSILAPHCDDELIGCYTLLKARSISKVYYFFDFTETRIAEARNCASIFGFEPIFVSDPENLKLDGMVLMPSLVDSHPHHKLIRRCYSRYHTKNFYHADLDTILNKNVLSSEDQADKLSALNEIYPSQKALWDSNASYYLFECITNSDYLKLDKYNIYYSGRLLNVTSDVFINVNGNLSPEQLLDIAVNEGSNYTSIIDGQSEYRI